MKKTTKESTNYEKIIKEFGNVISKGTELLQKKKDLKILSVGPALDNGLNGGLLEGSWNVISGAQKSGKTTTVLQIAANAIQENRKVIYLDGENRLKEYNMRGIEGLDLEEIDIIHSPDDRQLSAEEYLTIAEMLYKQEEYRGCVIVIDSTSSLLPRSELDAEVSGTIRANFPKMMAHWIKKNAQSIVNQRAIIILITHYVTNTSGYGKTKIADGGLYIQYQADTLLDVAKTEAWEEDGKKIGLKVTWKISASALGATGKEVTSYLRFGKGIDKIQEILETAIDFGIIEKSGAWYTIPSNKQKFQGMSRLHEYLSQNQDVFNEIKNELKKLYVD